MASRQWAPLAAGLALAAAGLIAFVKAPAPAATVERPAVVPVSAPAAAITAGNPSTASSGLPAAVAAALSRGGSLEVVDPASAGIPTQVGRLLAERGVVLAVPGDALPAPAVLP